MNLKTQLDQHRGFGPGFDVLRVALAVGILAWHSMSVVDHDEVATERGSWFFGYCMVPMFFALSGFLIAGSAQRLRLKDFLINRGLRIVPALAVEIIGSAFILGLIFTNMPRVSYLLSLNTWKYMTNIFGFINYKLPGVFQNLPHQIVNASLWTIPWEIGCYVIMSALIVLLLIRKPKAIILITIVWMCACLFAEFSPIFQLQNKHAYAKIVQRIMIFDQGPKLIIFFLLGIIMYLWREKIPYSKLLLAVSLAACVIIAAVFPLKFLNAPLMTLFAGLPLSYITVFIGATAIPNIWPFSRGDYSYGMYLYAFPIQQAIKSVFPQITNGWVLTVLAVPLVTVFAAFSWHCIEKPILRMRKNFSFVAKQRLAEGVESGANAERAPASGGG